MTRHFLDLDQLDSGTLRGILDLSVAIKKRPAAYANVLAGRTLAMIFEKASTRTRVSFDVGMRQLGGGSVELGSGSHVGERETMADTARVLSRYVDAIMIRTDGPEKLTELAQSATVPVINGLTDRSHPCQLMADIMTFEEHRGPIAGRTVAWVGDGNNVAASWLHAAVRFGFALHIATPPSLALSQDLLDWAKRERGNVQTTTDAKEAAAKADAVVTDTWVSMGDDDERDRRLKLLAPYQVDQTLMDTAGPEALFLHCLPAHRGEEVTAEVMDGPRSVVWDEAENRLHAQKGILAWCLNATEQGS